MFPAVLAGSFLDYDPRQVNVPVSIRVRFIPQVVLPAGSIVTLTLDQFGGPSTSNIMIFSTPEGAITVGAWNSTNCKFSILTEQPLLASEPVEFMVRSTYGST